MLTLLMHLFIALLVHLGQVHPLGLFALLVHPLEGGEPFVLARFEHFEQWHRFVYRFRNALRV